ncbi:putative mucin-associated surface protein (MASP) [Trypanosoma conorhini]|uniref:Putative mucin-associated surface protein (MASP) n=1 Tax=Trypanosoma conorhini TaxID=83891 RepID=A0A3R7KWH7_9TRYP|nr:putative mucin-associated surface protein (MASP) [Trypanosoma conorhini]RNF14817.1 putative mucin-associated surface protein (MASP) [Trypanosoma conorhini]
MTEVYKEETLVSSYPASPRPRRQPMASLSTNQRSYSRMSSKGIFGDESPLLLSPLPKYPNRRRSITFADETEATVREERPHYTVSEASNTPGGTPSESPSRRPIIKPASRALPGADAATSAVDASQRHDTTTHAPVVFARSPTPKRGRSNSRQRRNARRQQAELHHGFYDDSFVEEYVLKAKQEIAGEEEERRVEEKLRQQEKERAAAEMRAAQATVKINALQQAKEYLLATANARCVSPACSSVEPRESGTAARPRHHASKRELDLIQQLDDEIEAAEEIAQRRRQRPPAPVKHSMPLVTQLDEAEETGLHKRLRQSTSKKGGRSQPVQVNGQIDTDEDGDPAEEKNRMNKLKRAKLERIVARVIEQQAKRRHGKRSVVVIDWDGAESDELLSDDAEGERGRRESEDAAASQTRVVARSRRETVSKRPSEAAPTLATAPSAASTALGQQKPASAVLHVSVRAPSTRKRNATSASLAPELGEDSLLLEEDQPVLLRRPTARRRVPTRSISCVSTEAGDDAVFEPAVDVSRKPPRRAPAPKATRRGRKPPASATVPALAPHLPPSSVSPSLAAVHGSRSFASARQGSPGNIEPMAAPLPQPVTSRRRGRTASAAARPPAPAFPSDDPMAVFFGASFPSPSKFEEMVLAAGGIPDTRRVGRGQPRQPALVLPDSISRRR